MAIKHTFLRLKNSAQIPADLRGSSLAIGNFDGIHRGHQKVLREALQEAQATGRPAIVFTFEPHPRTFLKPEQPVYRLTTAAQKAACFKQMGFAAVIEQPFTAAFAAMSAENFVRNTLCDTLAISCIAAGENFHFGHKRLGTPSFLRAAGQKHGFKTILTTGLKEKNGQIICSGHIRTLLRHGKIAEANALLGHSYTIPGKIIHGQALGKQLGFPTANMALPAETQLKYGIYAVYFRLGPALHCGVASFGLRPTIEHNGQPLLETFIFNFNADIYGKQAEVLFIAYLRGEKKFADTESLIKQMHKDAAKAKLLLQAATPEMPFKLKKQIQGNKHASKAVEV